MKSKFAIILSLTLVIHAYAGSATWNLNPVSGDWNTVTNWMPNTIPDGPDDVATFDVSNSTTISVNSVEVNSIVFNPGASAYTINSVSIGSFSITGAGVINNSGTTQNIVATAPFAFLGVDNGASAGGNDVVLTAQGSSTSNGGTIVFNDVANGGNVTLIAEGSDVAVTFEGEIDFFDNSSAGSATVIADAGAGAGGLVNFMTSASADNATLIANVIANNALHGGLFIFSHKSSGSTGPVILNGNGTGDASNGELLLKRDSGRPAFAIGSLEGDGLLNVITPGGDEIDIGSNNLSTTFGGRVTGGATVTKVGTGTLTLTNGSSSYTATNVNEGALLVSNIDGLGAGGPITVNAGTLGGSGTVAGPVTVGTGTGMGAFFAPAYRSGKQATFTIQGALTFNADSTYSCSLKAKGGRARSDQVVASNVTIESGATFSLRARIQGTLPAGTVLTVISNTSANPITGEFGNLPDGGLISSGGTTFLADYEGGSGNDLTLTVQ